MNASPPVLPTRSSSTALAHAGPRLRTALPPRLLVQPVASAAGAVVVLTVLAALASALAPELGPRGRPHPTLHGTIGEALSIFVTNGRLLVFPLLLAVGRWPTGRRTRHLGDALVAALLIVNPVTVGLALGRFPIALLPYLPHLPLEDGTLATSVGAWVSRRLPARPGRRLRSVLSCALWTRLVTGELPAVIGSAGQVPQLLAASAPGSHTRPVPLARELARCQPHSRAALAPGRPR